MGNGFDKQAVEDSTSFIDSYVGNSLDAIKANYRSTGDVEIALLSVCGLIANVETLKSSNRSYKYCKLLTFYCDLKLATASSSADLEHIKNTAEKALDVVSRSSNEDKVIMNALASGYLYLSVALKANRDPDESLRVLNRAKKDLRKHFDPSYVDEILLTRQEILIRQDDRGFGELIDRLPSYIDSSPVEAYASIKRVLERCLNLGALKDAENLMPVFKEIFRMASPELGLLAKISFQKNLGHYLLLQNSTKKARRVLQRALRDSISAGFVGQSRQIHSLLSEIDGGTNPELPTFII